MKNIFTFFRQLRANNNREWFKAHKAEYDEFRAQWIEQIDRLISECSQWAPEYKWLDGKDCTFRIYRDVRFSTDKSPYKTYISSGIGPKGKDFRVAGYYVQASCQPEESLIFGGLWCPDREILRKMRHAIVDNIEEFESIISAPELVAQFPQWSGETLKTIPKGWPKDHPQAALLRLLHYGRQINLDEKFFLDPDWPVRASEIMRPLKPLIDFINYTITEE